MIGLRNKYANIPYIKCRYDDIFNYNLIDKAFRKKFREYVYIFRYYKQSFLKNPLVSKHIKESYKHLYYDVLTQEMILKSLTFQQNSI